MLSHPNMAMSWWAVAPFSGAAVASIMVDIITIVIVTIVMIRRADEADLVAAPYRRVPAYLIRRMQMISTSIIAEAFVGEDMSLSEWAVLTIIANHPDIDQSRLAEIVSIDRVNTGRLVDELDSRGLIERRFDEADRRVWRLRCTRRGLQTRKRLLPRALASQARLLACLSQQDRKIFIELMFQIVTANEQYVRPGAGRRKRKAKSEKG
jgi:DNA-binding MarR family transcriptional regulator